MPGQNPGLHECMTGKAQPFLQDVNIAHTDIHLFQLYAFVLSAFISDMKNLVGRSSIR